MSSLLSIVSAEGPIRSGERGVDVRALQIALSQAGYRVTVDPDGAFTDDTDFWVRRFQQQHGLRVDGVVGEMTASLLDAPHAALVRTAAPLVHEASGFPHDDTASLVAFYGDPDSPRFSDNLVPVTPPWPLTYDGKAWPHGILFHKKCAQAFHMAFDAIWQAAGEDAGSPILRRVSKFSGSYNNRPVRGSSRKSCHALGAAWDFDADELPLGHDVPASQIPDIVVRCVVAQKLFWGGNYLGRKDPMHVQAAHE